MDRRLFAVAGLVPLLGALLAGCGNSSIAVGINQPLPTITAQPMNQTVNLGLTVTFTVTASGTALTFQWQENGVNINGATSASFTTPPTTAADNGATFRVIISNAAGSVTSSSVTLQVNGIPVSISSQPMNQTVNVGLTATFSVTAAGSLPLSYQWQENGTNISGATSASYTTPPTIAGDNGATFRVIVSNAGGSVTSSSATLQVNVIPPSISSQPINQTVSVGLTATFSVTAAGSPPLSYQWQENGTNISGATSASYATPPTIATDNGATFRVIVSNAAGSQTSNPATLSVNSVAPPGTDVTTYKNDLARTGQNLTETALTTSNVRSTTFGLRHILSVMGKVDAQPLYLSKLNVAGALHNVVFVATEGDLVYAFDADSGAMLWSVSMLGANETTSDDRGCSQVTPEIGVTATPVIDRNAGPHGAIFVVAMSKDSGGSYHQRLHALDLTTGAELFGGPKEVQATFPNLSGQTTFDPGQYKERPGLVLLNGVIYTSWASHCDFTPYTGWIIGYNETTLAQTSVLNIAPNSNGGGPSIWMSGGAPAADSSGNIFLLAANGAFETTLTNGFPSQGDYGNAFVKLSTTNNAPAVADYFEMFNEASENGSDTDLGSGGAMLLPDQTDSGGTVRHLAVGAGKDGNLYVVDRDNMGKFNPASNNIWQEVSGVFPGGGIYATPAYFNHIVYYGDVGGTLKAFTITNARLSPTSHSGTVFGYPGTSPAVSANGGSNGIVWAAENSSPAVLHAYDATNLATELYNSNQAGSRDHCGNGNKFITPTIADGKVFLGTQDSVCVYGLF